MVNDGPDELYRPQFSMVQEFKITQLFIKDKLQFEKQANFSIEISEGLFEGLDTQANPYIQEFLLKTSPISMKCVFGINLKSSFEIYLLDMFNNKV